MRPSGHSPAAVQPPRPLPSVATPSTAATLGQPGAADPAGRAPRSDWATLRRLLPYLWTYKWRVMLALAFMVGAKGANVSVPLLLKELVDTMTPAVGRATGLAPGMEGLLIVPVGLLLAYGGLRFSTSLFTELRELIFAKATEGATRSIALQTFEHLHALSLRFHLERQTGGMTRDIERGTRGVQSLISYSLYSIVPTLIEVVMVLTLLGVKFEAWYVYTTLSALVLYIGFTVWVTEWRTQFRREMNELDSASHSKAIDSLLNYETVKYFNNEAFEAQRYDSSLEKLRRARIKSQTTLSLLNAGSLLAGGHRDVAEKNIDLAGVGNDLPHCTAGFFYATRAAVYLLDAGCGERLDFFCSRSRPARQAADFSGHNGKPTPPVPLCPCSRCLHRGIQRQDTGLESNPINDTDDVVDFRRR